MNDLNMFKKKAWYNWLTCPKDLTSQWTASQYNKINSPENRTMPPSWLWLLFREPIVELNEINFNKAKWGF